MTDDTPGLVDALAGLQVAEDYCADHDLQALKYEVDDVARRLRDAAEEADTNV